MRRKKMSQTQLEKMAYKSTVGSYKLEGRVVPSGFVRSKKAKALLAKIEKINADRS